MIGNLPNERCDKKNAKNSKGDEDMSVKENKSYREISLKSKQNVIKPKVRDGKVLLNRKDLLHRYFMED